MLGKIARFEFRYQAASPLFIAAAAFFLIGSFADMAVAKLATVGGGNVLFNSPHAIIVSHLGVSLLFLFLGAAFVSNVIVRDDQSGFGPILRSTRITKFDYLFGRFLGAFAAGALIVATVTAGAWIGTLMPFADQAMLGPNRLSGFAYGYGLFALPNAFIIAAILFALATATRSTAGTFVGVIALFLFYLVGQRLMENETELLTFRVLADPFGMTAYMASSRYFTAAELNAGAVPVTGLILLSRLLWVGIAAGLLALTYRLFRLSERAPSKRRQRRLQRQAALEAAPRDEGVRVGHLPAPRFGRRAAVAQFAARTAMEMRFILRSPAFLILLALAFLITLAGVMSAADFTGVALYPLSFLTIPIIDDSFGTILIVIAAYYGGELVWRERERRINEIIEATPLPSWGLMLPKALALALVLLAVLLVGAGVGLIGQAMDGGVAPAPGEYLSWYLLPAGADAILLAVLSVFVSAMSPGKYAGWAVMLLYILLFVFGPSMGLEHPLLIYGSAPAVPLSDMAGAGEASEAAWWFRLFWAAVAALLLIAAHLLWPRGAEQRLKPRLRQLPHRLKGRAGLAALAAGAVAVSSGSWIVYNTLILNDFRTSAGTQRYLAEYEKRFLPYARLPQPVVRHVALDVALHPEAMRAEVRGRYRLVNETAAPIDRVHVRLLNAGLSFVDANLAGARLEQDDKAFGYRIYRLQKPMQPGEARTLSFHTRRAATGFRASDFETGIAANGTDLNSLELAPRIGMSEVGLIEDPALRREYGLPERQPLPRLDDIAATRLPPNGDISWITADIVVSTSADQVPVAPGTKVSDHIRDGRRVARFVSGTPIKNLFSIQSARYAVQRERHDGIDYSVFYDPKHPWNVDRVQQAMRASIAYYRAAFGPYPFDHVRLVETPAYRRGGAQAFPGGVAAGESVFTWDVRNPADLDMVTLLTAHEIAHQWWGQQVVPARMEGAGLLTESLAQYSALMVVKRLRGEADIRRFLQFQRDRYLAGRRTEVLEEQPLASASLDQDYINYGKGALALYLLQERIGEAAVNRALRRFADRYRSTEAPYPRSVDLIALLRAEAKTPADQALITDLFERITLYDLKVETPTAVRRADGRWDVTVPVEARKYYASGSGTEKGAPFGQPVPIGLFTADPDIAGARETLRMEWRPVRSGRQVLRFVTDRRPTHAGIDPYLFFIDRNVGDNVAAVPADPPQP